MYVGPYLVARCGLEGLYFFPLFFLWLRQNALVATAMAFAIIFVSWLADPSRTGSTRYYWLGFAGALLITALIGIAQGAFNPPSRCVI
jgi:hypothetical protein